MAQWQCELRVSWRTQLFSLLMHGTLMLLTLLAPWPTGYTPFWLILLTLVILECIRSQKKLTSVQGVIRLKADNLLEWNKREWMINRPPWITRYGVLLALQQRNNNARQRLWLASDSMTEKEWRALCQLLRWSSDLKRK